ncbi:Uncharacterised protein g2309 [Pycnogonum litorale]
MNGRILNTEQGGDDVQYPAGNSFSNCIKRNRNDMKNTFHLQSQRFYVPGVTCSPRYITEEPKDIVTTVPSS